MENQKVQKLLWQYSQEQTEEHCIVIDHVEHYIIEFIFLTWSLYWICCFELEPKRLFSEDAAKLYKMVFLKTSMPCQNVLWITHGSRKMIFPHGNQNLLPVHRKCWLFCRLNMFCSRESTTSSQNMCYYKKFIAIKIQRGLFDDYAHKIRK